MRLLVLLFLCILAIGFDADIANAQTRSSIQAQNIRNPSIQEGMRAYYTGDHEEAMRQFLKLAHRGDAEAQYFLGYMYDTGQGISADKAEAARWYERAAVQGYMPAEVYTGYIYAVGNGRRKDLDKAKAWYKKAAVKGDMIAQNNLGSLLQQEEGNKQSLYQAAQWFLASAMQGNPSAQFNLANMYREGKAIRRDLEKAVKWYMLAALQGDEYAQNALGYMYMNGYGVDKNVKSAVQWYKRAAEQNLTAAQYQLASLYQEQGKLPGLKDNIRQSYEHTAAVWYAHAANNGHKKAAFELADMYRTGTGVKQDVNKAVSYLEQLVEGGYDPAKLKLASYLENGEGGIKADPAKALNWYEEAASEGDGNAMFEAGRMNYDGSGTSKDLVEAYKWFALAVENLPEGDPKREDAIIARVEVSNAMSATELDRARSQIAQWQARPAR